MTAEMAMDVSADNNETDENTGKAGRPRSEKARKKILDATRRLLTHMSMDELSIEAIAKKAKVGKTTIYRWWPNKAAVAMEAFLEQPGIMNVVPKTATPDAAIIHLLESLLRQLRGQNGRIIAGIIAESQSNEEILDLLYEAFLKERVEILYEKIEEGKKTGLFNKDIDTTIAIDMMMGPLFLRVLSGESAIDNFFAENFPRQAMVALKN
ncbi:MAG: TetR/AcrR family transcriptional regulator [Rhodospirillales bacterium]|nr:TetR/AcrR family transcriptional regulator [Rhodospirillales bacterium]